MILIPVLYFVKPLSEGKELRQSDIVNHIGVSKGIEEHREKYNEEPLWTDRVFGGMPTYMISTKYSGNKIRIIHRIFMLNYFTPVSYVFLLMLGFYIALTLFGVKPWLSLMGTIIYAFSSYFFIIIAVGHNSKVVALGYMPPIIAGVYSTYKNKSVFSSMIVSMFLALQILANHLQITYYTVMIIITYLIYEFNPAIKEKRVLSLIKPSFYLLIAILLAVGSNFSQLWTTIDYLQYSTRGRVDERDRLTIPKPPIIYVNWKEVQKQYNIYLKAYKK